MPKKEAFEEIKNAFCTNTWHHRAEYEKNISQKNATIEQP
tara:strand:- start:602 stop:721 length:120 start_codon:yes stop_codon:yes gene_type:complete